MIAGALMFVVHELTLSRAVPQLEISKNRVDTLNAELDSLAGRLERAEARKIVAEREAEIVRQANQILRQEESERQAEIGRLQAELEFFRRLAGTGASQAGLAVYEAQLIPTESERVFQFILTLTQNMRSDSVISGRALIEVEGTLNDRAVTLKWPQLADGAHPEPGFRFKYFQQLKGYLSLPGGFEPTRLQVTLEAQGQRDPVRRSFRWARIAAATGD